VALAAEVVRAIFADGWLVRVQLPLALDDISEPEPDVAVVPGTARDYRRIHPSEAVLVVEVADTSLRLDRKRKASAYARVGIADYWIVNLVDGVLEVHRQPSREGRRWRYASVEILGPEAVVTPLAAPGARVRVADLLP
jgi:Uma2 family endonuclease